MFNYDEFPLQFHFSPDLREKNRLESKDSEDMAKVTKAIFEVQAEVNALIEENQAFNKMCEKKYAELIGKVGMQLDE